MNPAFWIVLAALAAVLSVPAVLAAYRAADEARRLGRAVQDLRGLRPALVEIRRDARRLSSDGARRP